MNQRYVAAFLLFLLSFTTRVSAQTITHGPICGAVRPSRASFVIRTSAAAPVWVELSTNEAFTGTLIRTDTITTVLDSDFFAIVSAAGLKNDTRYYYRAYVNGIVSSANPTATKIQTFSTFPQAGSLSSTRPLVIDFGSCQRDGKDPGSNKGNIYPLIARDNASLFLQLGDWGYPDTTQLTTPGDYFSTKYSRVQQSYRSKYQNDYPMDTLFVTTPIDYVYDDHDYSGDNSDMTSPNPENSIRGYNAMFPHYAVANPSSGSWHKFTCGNAEFFFVDDRIDRTPNIANFDTAGGKFSFSVKPFASMLQGNPAVTGEKQLDWLISSLKASTATWKFVVSGVAFNPADRATVELALALQGTPYDPVSLPDGSKVPAAYVAINLADSWCAFPNDIAKLIDSCHQNAVQNVIFLTGDSHNAAMDDGTHSFFPEIMAGGLDISNSHTVALKDAYGVQSWQTGQLAAANNFNNAFGRLMIYGNDSVQFELKDELGAVIGRMTRVPGHIVETTGLMLAPNGINFGNTTVGTASYGAVIVLNTGGDSLKVTNVTTTDPQFTPLITKFALAPGEKIQLPVLFVATSGGQKQAGLLLTSNVPSGISQGGLVAVAVASGVSEQPEAEQVTLYPNYPNPVGSNYRTMFMYEIKQSGTVRLSVIDAGGHDVRTVVNAPRVRGSYFEDVSLAGLANGTYFVRLEINGVSKTQKMTIAR